MTDSSRWDALADALSFSTGNPGLDEMLRASLRAGAASDANLSRHVRDFELRNDAALDIHLHGEAEDRHVSRGDLLGRFLRDVTEAVKQLAKDSGGLSRHSVNLWVHAPAPGSMRLQLRTLVPDCSTQAPQSRR